MKGKKIIIFLLIILILIVVAFIYLTRIPADYMSIFHGEYNNTYIYKIENGVDHMGFKYINTTKVAGKEIIIGTGEVTSTDDFFPIAKKNNAYLYVTIPDIEGELTIEEYQEIFRVM